MRDGLAQAWLVAVVVLVCGCSEDGPVEGENGARCDPPHRLIATGQCVPSGVGDDGCPAGTLAQGEACVPAGVPPQRCAEGFVPEEDGCAPLLPAEPCGPGFMAVPGDTRCRAVADCASGTWGDIVVDASTQYVDASFSGATSDGSATQPWKTIGEAVSASSSGAVVAIAAGVYAEDILLSGKPVRLWGVCPALVELRGSGSAIAALDIRAGATSSEVHGIAITSGHYGIGVSGAEDVVVERVWIHDTDARGIDVEDTLGPASANIVGSLVETAVEVGVFMAGAPVTMDSSVVRGTLPLSDMTLGRGLGVQLGLTGSSAKVTLARSVIESNHELGMFCGSSELTLEGTVVRLTSPQASDDELGAAIGTAATLENARPKLTVRGSWLAENHGSAIIIEDSDVDVDDSV
ncbi:MAG TPA: hypothetical protein VFB62_06055, partial [Polyangiaceae bacterium]|nr:hypothetical protein [Polyangiaceae bacterium]